jgi:hypothetical protein
MARRNAEILGGISQVKILTRRRVVGTKPFPERKTPREIPIQNIVRIINVHHASEILRKMRA